MLSRSDNLSAMAGYLVTRLLLWDSFALRHMAAATTPTNLTQTTTIGLLGWCVGALWGGSRSSLGLEILYVAADTSKNTTAPQRRK